MNDTQTALFKNIASLVSNLVKSAHEAGEDFANINVSVDDYTEKMLLVATDHQKLMIAVKDIILSTTVQEPQS